MDRRRISMSEIVLGKPLRWDVYDGNNHLLLTKGFVVERPRQVETLLERGRVEGSPLEDGLFIKLVPKRTEKSAKPVEEKEAPSALRLINEAYERLDWLLFNLPEETAAEAEVFKIAELLSLATAINRDVALACILLNQNGDYAVRHCIDTAIVALLVAQSLNNSPGKIRSLVAAALTMNVAMVPVQQALQNKKGALTENEIRIIRRHPYEGFELLQDAGITDPDWLACVLDHHENEDGSGYPRGKSGREITEITKILAIADRYCARVVTRQYRKTLLPNAALRDILLADKKNVDPSLVASFIRELGTYPTGTFVRLVSGEIGVVTGKGATTTMPIVHALVGPRGEPLSFAIRRDTSVEPHCIREVLYEEQAAIRFSMHQLWEDAAKL
jgi:HD-GYP domain-containing protein (c-di-GMP phosphodiesterase class II)